MQNRIMTDSWLVNELDELDADNKQSPSEDLQLQEIIEKTREEIAQAFGNKQEINATLVN